MEGKLLLAETTVGKSPVMARDEADALKRLVRRVSHRSPNRSPAVARSGVGTPKLLVKRADPSQIEAANRVEWTKVVPRSLWSGREVLP